MTDEQITPHYSLWLARRVSLKKRVLALTAQLRKSQVEIARLNRVYQVDLTDAADRCAIRSAHRCSGWDEVMDETPQDTVQSVLGITDEQDDLIESSYEGERYRWSCAFCDEMVDDEFDPRGKEVECDACGARSRVAWSA